MLRTVIEVTTQDLKHRFEGKFDEVKGRIKEAYGVLSEDDLRQTEGRWDQLVGTISQRTGEDRDAVEKRLEDMFNALP